MPASDPRLRILVIVSRPLLHQYDSEHGGHGLLPVELGAIDVVRRGLSQLFQDDRTPALVRYLPWARLEDMQMALAEPYHVVHIVAHGADNGHLLLEGDDGIADVVAPARLSSVMEGSGVQLALISGCFSGLAGKAMHAAGIPNVVMVDEQYPMAARAAALFNRQFYARLARGHRPSQAFAAGITAVQNDKRVGDTVPMPVSELTGQPEPSFASRFDKILSADQQVVLSEQPLGHEEWRPVPMKVSLTRNETFFGREHDMVSVLRLLAVARMVTLTGPGGIGKTALARQIALWLADRCIFRDGVVEVSLQDCQSPEDLAIRLTAALEMEYNSLDAWASLRRMLARKKLLLLLDGAGDLSADAVHQLQAGLLSQCEQIHLLVTSQAPLNLAGYEQVLVVHQLAVGTNRADVGPAEHMFLSFAPIGRYSELVRNSLDTIQTICRELDGYPLGILLCAVQLSDERETPDNLLEALQRNMVDALQYSRAAGLPDRHKSIGAALKGSYDKLDDPARQLLAHIATFPGGVREPMIVDIEGLAPDQWNNAERTLRDLHLVNYTASQGGMPPMVGNWMRTLPVQGSEAFIDRPINTQGLFVVSVPVFGDARYAMISPIRAWAQTTMPSDAMPSYRRRAANWLARLARILHSAFVLEYREAMAKDLQAHLRETDPTASPAPANLEYWLMLEAMRNFDSEQANFDWATDWAEAQYQNVSRGTKDCASLANLVEVFCYTRIQYFETRAFWHDMEVAAQKALTAMIAIGNRQGMSRSYLHLGLAYWRQSRTKEAMAAYHDSLKIARSSGDKRGESFVLHNIGMVHQREGRLGEALDAFQKSQQLKQSFGAHLGDADTLNNIGSIYLTKKHYAQALKTFNAGLHIATVTHDHFCEAKILGNIGSVYSIRKDYATALSIYEKALEVFRVVGSPLDEGIAMMNIGTVRRSQHRWSEAMQAYRKAYIVFHRIASPLDEIDAIMNAAEVRQGRKHFRLAQAYYSAALSLARSVNSLANEAHILERIGLLCHVQSKWTEALSSYKLSAEAYRRAGNANGEARVLVNIATLFVDQGDKRNAESAIEQAQARIPRGSTEYKFILRLKELLHKSLEKRIDS